MGKMVCPNMLLVYTHLITWFICTQGQQPHLVLWLLFGCSGVYSFILCFASALSSCCDCVLMTFLLAVSMPSVLFSGDCHLIRTSKLTTIVSCRFSSPFLCSCSFRGGRPSTPVSQTEPESVLHLLFLDSAIPSFMVVAARPSFFTEQAVQQSSSSCTATLPCLLAVAVTFVVQWRALFCSSSAALVSSVGHLFGTGECSPLPLASSGSVMCCICCELSKFDGSSCCFVGYVSGEAC